MAWTTGSGEQGPVAGLVRLTRDGGGERILVDLVPWADRAYLAATLRAVGARERRLGPAVVANRITRYGRPEPWRQAHARWRRDLAAAVREGSSAAAFTGDVRDCYGSISPALVERRLSAVGGDPAAGRVILEMLDACAAHGVTGLPVGPVASGILANVVLAVIDDHLRTAGLPHRRWVDDVVTLAPDRRTATRAHDAFRRGLDDLRLEPHLGKTGVMHRRADILRLASVGASSPAGDDGVG